MFGYVTVNQDELKMREVRRYRGFYCGLCRSLRSRHGIRGQAILPYDMVFVDILLNANERLTFYIGLIERNVKVLRFYYFVQLYYIMRIMW